MKVNVLRNYIRESILILKEENEDIEAEESDSESELNSQRGPTFGDLQSILGLVKKANWTKAGLKAATRFASAYVGNDIISKIFPKGTDSFNEAIVETGVDYLSMFVSKAIGKKFDIKSAASPEKFLAKIYGINDNPGLAKIEVPNEISELIDDKVEASFMISLYKTIAEEAPNKVIPNDYVLDELKKYTSQEHNKTKGAAPVEI